MECCGYLINDHHLGEEICENCGKSISTIYSDNTFVEEEDDFIEYLDNVCANNHISKIISDEAKTIFNKNNNDKSKEYLAYCLYQASIIHDAGRTLQEISKMFGISSTSIAKKEKIPGKGIYPSDLVSRVCFAIDMTQYKIQRELKTFSNNAFNILPCCPPQSVLALCLASPKFAQMHKKKCRHCKSMRDHSRMFEKAFTGI